MTSALEFAVDRTRQDRLRTAWQGVAEVGGSADITPLKPSCASFLIMQISTSLVPCCLAGRVALGLVRGLLRHALHHQAHGLDYCMRYLEQHWHAGAAPRGFIPRQSHMMMMMSLPDSHASRSQFITVVPDDDELFCTRTNVGQGAICT